MQRRFWSRKVVTHLISRAQMDRLAGKGQEVRTAIPTRNLPDQGEEHHDARWSGRIWSSRIINDGWHRRQKCFLTLSFSRSVKSAKRRGNPNTTHKYLCCQAEHTTLEEEFFVRNFLRICVVRGENLDRSHYGSKPWGAGNLGAPEIHARRPNAKEVMTEKWWEFHFPSQRWKSEASWDRSGSENIHLNAGTLWKSRLFEKTLVDTQTCLNH